MHNRLVFPCNSIFLGGCGRFQRNQTTHQFVKLIQYLYALLYMVFMPIYKYVTCRHVPLVTCGRTVKLLRPKLQTVIAYTSTRSSRAIRDEINL